jgi:uncharacterized protein (TIGR02285 family)
MLMQLGRGFLGRPAAFLSEIAIRCLGLMILALFVAIIFGPGAYGADGNGGAVTLTGDSWPPYLVGELGEEAHSGIAVELVREIFARLPEADVSFPMIPWNRALREVETGTKDGFVMLLKTPERERYMEYTDPLFTAYNLVWYTTDSFPSGFGWEELPDLSTHTIGVTRGYSYGDEIDLAVVSGALSITPVPTVGHLFAMLARGRIDLALANDAVGYALALRYEQKAEIVPAKQATGTHVYHLAFSRKSNTRLLIPRINSIISELRDEGYIDGLMTDQAGPP